MITRQVREWMDKVQRRQYSYDDAMQEFINLSKILTKEEILMVKKKLENSYR